MGCYCRFKTRFLGFINKLVEKIIFLMKHILTFLIIFSVILSVFTACNPSKKISNQCSTEGTLRDMTGLDGCKFLIELEDGSRLNPVEYSVKSFNFEDGQQIRFSYEKVETMNVCMAGQTVKVTCLQLL